MRIRKLLLIHPSRSTRALIKKYVYSELSDIEFFEADNGRQALEKMTPENFDVIISTDQLKDMDVAELKSGQLTTPANGHTPLIIISESESPHVHNELKERGFERVVQIRLRPADLIHSINVLCNPRNWRQDTRYHIPGTTVSVCMPHARIQAVLINISKGGILVEMSAEQPELLMMGSIHIAFEVPVPATSSPVRIEALTGKLLRLEVMRWKTDLTPAAMRATFIFHDLNDGPRNQLEEILQMAKADKLSATEVQD